MSFLVLQIFGFSFSELLAARGEIHPKGTPSSVRNFW